jgi:formate dehydrogenase beta subunit
MDISRRTAFKILGAGAAMTAGGAATLRASEPDVPVPPDAVGMLYDTTLCIGCKACMVACREANDLEPDTGWSGGLYQAPADLNASTKNIIKLYQDGTDRSFMKAQCMHCIDPACVAACMVGALKKREHGIVSWDGTRCVGCRYCQIACPFNIPKFEWRSANPRIVKCELCRHRLAKGQEPACTEVCPKHAVIYGTRAALLAEAKKRLAENPGKYVNKVYGEHDGGGTQVLYLSHIAFEKLGLPTLTDRPVPELVRHVQDTIYKGFAAPLVLFGVLGAIVMRNRKAEQDAEAGKDAR